METTAWLIVLAVGIVALGVMMIIALNRLGALAQDAGVAGALAARLETLIGQNERLERELRAELATARNEAAQHALAARGELSANLVQVAQTLQAQLAHAAQAQTDRLATLTQSNEQRLDAVRATVEQKLDALRNDNAQKLEQMRQTVDEKLHRHSNSGSANRSSLSAIAWSWCIGVSARCRR